MSYKFDRSVTGGPPTQGGGSIHLSFSSASRARGSSSASGYDYIAREREFDGPDRDPVVYTESEHMPSWAEEDPRIFWDAADMYERANGRLDIGADFALPRELDQEDRIELAREFAHELTEKEQLPYTLAVHAGLDHNGEEHNPHAHLMFSERRNDGIERSPREWFARANPANPECGGAVKSRTFHGPEWVEAARERWAELVNQKLEERGFAERVDHRSCERQGLNREPGTHYGPSASHFVGRGESHDRLESALDARNDEAQLRQIDDAIVRLEELRASIVRDGLVEERTNDRDYSYSWGGGGSRSDDHSWGR